LITHLNLGTLDLSRTTHLVLDEADRMLDMGFCEDILKIVEQLPKNRQTILFSATMPEKIVSLAHQIMHDPQTVSIAVSKPVDRISQEVFVCREQDKESLVCNIFRENPPRRVIVFASSKQKVKALHLSLLRKGYNVAAMHSDLEQKQRDEVMMAFKAQRVDVLVATDIVARGIDIDDITLVINYDAPRESEDYVHRIGRTARAGKDGRAVTLVGEKDRGALASIENFLGYKITRIPLPEGMIVPNDIEVGIKKNSKKNRRHRKTSIKRKGKSSKEQKGISNSKSTEGEPKKNGTPHKSE
jgi:superfamily II DNA/RNA helicase